MYQILKGLVYLHDKSISHRGKYVYLGHRSSSDDPLITDLKVNNPAAYTS